MKTVLISCDICGSPKAFTRIITVDRKMDGAGSMDDEIDYIDLCGEHTWELCELALQKLTHVTRQEILATLRSRTLRGVNAQ